MIIDKNTGEHYIIEVNASPGVKGITSVSDVPPIDHIFDFLKQFKYINNSASVIGITESAKLIFGDIVHNTPVTFNLIDDINIIETGSTYYNEDTRQVTFLIGNNTITRPVIGTLIEQDNVTRSYLVQANVEFNDHLYKNVIFKVKQVLADEYHVSMSNSFLSQIGSMVSIDPNTSYLVTDPIE
jgi:hypothetical protein